MFRIFFLPKTFNHMNLVLDFVNVFNGYFNPSSIDGKKGSITTYVLQKPLCRKNNDRWKQEEEIKLVEGVRKYGVGRWKMVKRDCFFNSVRKPGDLKVYIIVRSKKN